MQAFDEKRFEINDQVLHRGPIRDLMGSYGYVCSILVTATWLDECVGPYAIRKADMTWAECKGTLCH
jgi:hypothetical protein